MSIENCLQVSTIATARAGVLRSRNPFSFKEKLHSPTHNGLRISNYSMSYSFSSSAPSFNRKNLSSRVMCKAREATDAVVETGNVSTNALGGDFFVKNTKTVELWKHDSAVQAVTEANWKELVLGSKTLVLVDFWAPWCGPCRMIAPVVDELAKEYAGKIQCYKLNTDDCPNLPTQLGIRSIPTVLFFKNGERKESIIGAVPKSTLAASIDKYLDG